MKKYSKYTCIYECRKCKREEQVSCFLHFPNAWTTGKYQEGDGSISKMCPVSGQNNAKWEFVELLEHSHEENE